MNYYIFNYDPDALGYTPQCTQRQLPLQGKVPLLRTVFPKPGEKYPDDLLMETFEVHQRARLTDMLRFVGGGLRSFLLSEPMYDLLKSFDLCTFQHYATEATYRKKTYPYHYLYFWDNNNDFVDYEKSSFYVGDTFSKYKKRAIKVLSAKHFYQLYHENLERNRIIESSDEEESVLLSELYINPEKANLDLFFIAEMIYVVVVSERLKDALEGAGFRGMKFTPANGYKRMLFDFETKARLQ